VTTDRQTDRRATAYSKRERDFTFAKKEGLDAIQCSIYRPVSNLPLLSKLREKVVSMRLQQHLDRIDGIPKFQLAYRRSHSTETALLKVMNNFLRTAELGKVSVLCLLDLSAAFDTADHQLLLTRQQRRFGVVSKALLD